MKWPLYENVSRLLYSLNPPPEGDDHVFVYFTSIVYCLIWAITIKRLILPLIKYLFKPKRQESFWDKYDTGGNNNEM